MIDNQQLLLFVSESDRCHSIQKIHNKYLRLFNNRYFA